jgi:hypothetical protein
MTAARRRLKRRETGLLENHCWCWRGCGGEEKKGRVETLMDGSASILRRSPRLILFRAGFSGCCQLSIESSFARFRRCWLHVIMVKQFFEYVQTPVCLTRFYGDDLEGRLISYTMS